MTDPIVEINDPFWFNDPKILIRQDRLPEFFPVESLTINEKLNAILRLGFYIGIFLIFYYKNINMILVPIFIALITLYLYKYNTKQSETEKFEGFIDEPICQMPSENNPFMNTLLTDVGVYKEKLPACDVTENKEVKKEVENLFEKKLFRDVNDIYDKSNGQRQFYTMPNTNEYGIKAGDTVELGNWLYNTGEASCKEDNEQCTRGNTFYYEDLDLKGKPHLLVTDSAN